ncbi:chondroitinase-B domain-containing protein [Paenibacillus plantarum]|nr:chondroitinase-B domain-containing protein [Paenibacillus plantarum]
MNEMMVKKRKLVSGVLSVLLLLTLCLAIIPTPAASAAGLPLTEDFESYGNATSGYTSPVASTSTSTQPWKSVVGGSTTWSMDEEAASGGATQNHFLRQTDATTGITYVVTNDQWGAATPTIQSSDLTLSGKLKVTGANSTYAGLVARYSGSGTTATYYRFTMKKNSSSYQFYLEKVTGNTKISVPQTAGTPNASGVSVTNTTLSTSFDSLGYLPVKLQVIQNTDGSLTLQGYYGSTLILSGTDTTPYTSGQVGVYSYAGATAFDDIQVELKTAKEDFESYGNATSGYTSPVGSASTSAQPWKTVVGGSTSWQMGEEAAAVGLNHFLKQTDTTTGVTYVLSNDQWGATTPAIQTGDLTLIGKLKITGANSTYAGLVARYSGSGATATYYRFTMKKNSSSYQFYLEKVTGSSKISVPQTAGTPNASGVSVTNTTLGLAFDSLGYLPVKLQVIQNTDGSLKLEGYYGSTLVLSGTDTAPYTSGQVGLYSYAGATAFDDITATATSGSTSSLTVPSAPTNVTTSLPSTGAVNITWTASSTATGYNVKMASSGSGPFTTMNASPIAATNYTVTGLSVGQTYYFVVSAVNTAGEGSNSSPAISATPQTIANPPVSVSNSTQLAQAINAASPGAVIELENGNYATFSITGKHGDASNPIVIKAKNKGMAVFNAGPIKFTDSSYITIQDMTFVMDSTASNWIRITGCNHMRITNNYFHSPSSATDATKSSWVYIDGWSSHHNQVDHNLMENKKDRGKFILFDGNRDTVAGTYEITQYDVVEYNIFRNTLPRQENESEGIRLGVTDLVHLNAYATIQYNIFDHVDSDPEYVSVKSGGNVIRYNYFIESLGEVSLRSGNGSSVYGNMFIGNGREVLPTNPDSRTLGTGGVRVYGQNHKVYNNYFQGLTGTEWDATIALTTGDNDNLTQPIPSNNHYIAKNIMIANNTLVDNKGGIELGFVRYGMAPQNVTFANNVVVGGQQELIKIMTPIPGLSWSGNIMFPQQGMPLITGNSAALTETEVKVAYPMMKEAVLNLSQADYAWLWTSSEYDRLRSISYKKLAANSPAINSSIGNYGSGGALSFVTEDVEREARAGVPDVGADEYTADPLTDLTAPSWSSGTPLSLGTVTPRQVTLSWPAANDDTNIVGYRIYRNGVLYDTTFANKNSYTATELLTGTSYTFKIEALDQANRTTASNTITAATPAMTGITISGVPASIALGGGVKQLQVTAHFADSSTEDATEAGAAFTSSQAGVVSVSSGGGITGVALGSATVSASYNGFTSSALTITVKTPSQTKKVVDADTYVDSVTSTNANTNYSTTTTMLIQTDGGKQVGYMKVAVPTLSGTVDTVQLRLYVASAQAGADLLLHGIATDSWDPTLITAANQPARAFTDVGAGDLPVTAGSYVTFDVTKYVQTQSDGTLSFRLSMVSDDNPATVYTREYTDLNKAPTLIFTTITP